MKDRLQRRKKKTPEPGSQPAPPPLQPAYFDAEAPQPEAESAPDELSQKTPHESNQEEAEVAAVAEPEFETQPVGEESANAARSSRPTPAGDGARGRGRRRRGGRGRGGRGREQAVAQAFTPAAAKGIAPDQNSGEEVDPEVGASEDATPEPETQVLPPAARIPAAAPRLPKGIVVLAIGLPGSGKSSWFKRHSVVPLSSDMVRSLLFDDVREQRFQDLVFSNLRSMLKARLIAKRPMNYVDATNLTPQERQHWIKLAKDYNYEVHAVFFDVPLEVCLERHQRRDRVVPEDVMRRMAAKLKAPAFEEGFAKITVVRVKKKE